MYPRLQIRPARASVLKSPLFLLDCYLTPGASSSWHSSAMDADVSLLCTSRLAWTHPTPQD
jgi:hypothetical protein